MHCRFKFPKLKEVELAGKKSVVATESKLVSGQNRINLSVLPRRPDGMERISEFCDWMLSFWRANGNMQMLADSDFALYYVLKYCVKHETYSDVNEKMLELLMKQRHKPMREAWRTINRQIVNWVLGKRSMSM